MLKNNWTPILPKTPFWVMLHYEVVNRLYTWDLDNVLKAVNDAAQNAVFPDDRWLQICFYVGKDLGKDSVAWFTVGTMDEKPGHYLFDADFPWIDNQSHTQEEHP